LAKLAEAKAWDSLLLFEHGRHSNAYYLAGYAIEIGLKAIIAGEFRSDTFPDKGFVGKIFVHNLEALVGLAGLATELRQRRQSNPRFDSNWAIAANWTEEARYEVTDSMRAAAMLDAVLNEEDGLLPWLKTHW
jgi:hypothetical protein